MLTDPFFWVLFLLNYAAMCLVNAWEHRQLRRQGGVGTVGRTQGGHIDE